MKVSIFSFAVNDKFPIDIMHRQFVKYMKEDFEFILFNDATDAKMAENINTITSYNNIKCVRVPQHIHKIHNPSTGYATTLNWSIHEYAAQNNCDIISLMHSDVFPICDVSISDIIGNNTVASTIEGRIINEKRIIYFYPAFTIINMKQLKNVQELDFGLDTGLDTGGKTKNFINNYPDSVKFLSNHQTTYFFETSHDHDSLAPYFRESLNICKKYGISAGWIADGFYHYLAGSQWNADNPTFAEGHRQRMELFLKYFY